MKMSPEQYEMFCSLVNAKVNLTLANRGLIKLDPIQASDDLLKVDKRARDLFIGNQE